MVHYSSKYETDFGALHAKHVWRVYHINAPPIIAHGEIEPAPIVVSNTPKTQSVHQGVESLTLDSTTADHIQIRYD